MIHIIGGGLAGCEVAGVPALDGPVIVATGPLTSESLSRDIAALVGSDHLYFYDAISPIVLADTIDMSKVFRASRWGRSSPAAQSTVVSRQSIVDSQKMC